MRTLAISDPVAWEFVCQSVSLSVCVSRCAKTAERIEVLLGVDSLGTQETFLIPLRRCGLSHNYFGHWYLSYLTSV